MKNFYILATEKQGTKYNAFVFRYYQNYNLLSVLKQYPNIITANIYDSKAKAEEIAQEYNNGYKKNGNYLFD
jgi:hypothetical protein